MSIVLVAGFGRCGTSMVMRMLDSGGFPVHPKNGYPDYEDDIWFSGGVDLDWWRDKEGSAVKALEPCRIAWPNSSDLDFKVIWLKRNPLEQARSQIKLLEVAVGHRIPNRRGAIKAFARENTLLGPVRDWMKEIGAGTPLDISFEDVLANPLGAARRFSEFIGSIDVEAAADQVVTARTAKCFPGFLENQMTDAPLLVPAGYTPQVPTL